jgi:hypothetical protein
MTLFEKRKASDNNFYGTLPSEWIVNRKYIIKDMMYVYSIRSEIIIIYLLQ